MTCRCRNCESWKPLEESPGFGVCQAVITDARQPEDARPFTTGDNFGCVHFKKRAGIERVFLHRETRFYGLSKAEPDRDRQMLRKLLHTIGDSLQAGQGWVEEEAGAAYAYSFPLTIRIDRMRDHFSLRLVGDVSGPGLVLKDRSGAWPLIELKITGEL